MSVDSQIIFLPCVFLAIQSRHQIFSAIEFHSDINVSDKVTFLVMKLLAKGLMTHPINFQICSRFFSRTFKTQNSSHKNTP